MEIRTNAPSPVLEGVRTLGADHEDLIVTVATDIDLMGRYRPQWLVASPQRLWVFDESEPAKPRLELEMSQASEFRTIAVVGSGIFQAKVDGVWLDLARYSNRLKHTFGRISRSLDQFRNREKYNGNGHAGANGNGQAATEQQPKAEVALLAPPPKPVEAPRITKEDLVDPRRCAKCGLLRETPVEVCPRCVSRGAALSRISQLMRPYWRSALLMMVLLLAGIGLDVLNPLLTRYLVDHVLTSDKQGLIQPVGFLANMPPGRILLVVVGALASIQFMRAFINLFNGRVGSVVATSITYDMRGRLVDHLEKLSLSYYDKQQVGSLVGRVAYDTEAVQGFVHQLTNGLFMQILLVFFSLFMMFSLEPKLAMWTLIPAPLVMCGSYIFYRFVHPHYHRFWDRSSKQAGMLSGLLSGVRVVKAFAQEGHELNRFQTSSARLRDARRRVDLSAATFYPMMGLVFMAGGWIVWYVGGQNVLKHNMGLHGITLGTLMAFFGYLGMFYGPLGALTNLTSWLTQFSTQMQRIFEVLDTPIGIPDTDKPVPMPVMKGDIEFRNVIFGYSRQTPILKNVSFHIRPGETIGVVGRSGSGKTTVINLISRFYDVDEGSILIDGVDLRDITTHDLRRQIGVVLQEPFLFRGTIWDNLAYGAREADVPTVLAASRAGNCHDFIMRQIHGYDTWVGERGAGLSGGERQRISIARALLCEPRVLILDEATSSIDSESELQIQTALNELVKGRTSIIIAHRLSTLRNCDRIMVVDDGKISESGTHAELMQLNGHYAKLVRIQSGMNQDANIDTLALAAKDEKAGKEEKPAAVAPELKLDPDTGLAPITSHKPRWLRPEIANIHLGNLEALHVTVRNEAIYHGVYCLRCLPVRYPTQFISLRYIDHENREREIGLIRDLNDWPKEAQELIQRSLLRRYFVHTIERVYTIKQFSNYLSFEADTDLGKMEFIMRYAGECAQDYGKGGKILLDVEENRYLIPDLSKLPPADRVLFERFIYW